MLCTYRCDMNYYCLNDLLNFALSFTCFNRQHYLLLLFKIKFMKVKGISCSLFNVI